MKLHYHRLNDIQKEHHLPEHGNHGDGVHVWCHAIHYDDPFLREAPYLLSQEENLRAGKYHFEKDQRIYKSGHVFIRKILAHYTSQEASKLKLSPVVNQKPRLEGSPFSIHFNISHSGSKILVAVGFNSDVGIDVEKIIPDFDMDGFAEANYHPNELNRFRKMKNDEEAEYFYTIWTRKEAWLKLTGEGVNDKLRELDFSGGKGHPTMAPHGMHELNMISWKETNDYIATLACSSNERNVRFFSSDALVADMIE